MTSAPFATSPAHGPARAARAAIDASARAIRDVPLRLDRAAIAARLARAAQLLYVVIESDADAPVHLDALVESTRAFDEARALVARGGDPQRSPELARAIAPLEASISALARAAEAVGALHFTARGGGRARTRNASGEPIRASFGAPGLHAIARDPIAPALTLAPREPIAEPRAPRPDPPPKPRSIEELRAQAIAAREPGPAAEEDEDPGALQEEPRAPEMPVEDHAIVRHVARDCLEDIASLRVLRKANESESWTDQAPFEQRLLDNLDAFASLGAAALPSITLYHAEAAAPDAGRGFALAFTLGCLAGRDAVDVAIGTFEGSAPEEEVGWAEGFALASSPEVDVRLGELVETGDERQACFALEVLGWRAAVPAHAPAVSLARRDPGVDRALAWAAGRALPRDAALDTLRAIRERSTTSDELFDACVESLLRRGDGDVRGVLREALRAGTPARGAIAARWLALAGNPDDTAAIAEVARVLPSPALVRAIGRHGDVRSIDALIRWLEADEPIAEAAAEALDRITGAPLVEKAEVAWSAGAEPGAATRVVARPSRDPALWSQWRDRFAARLDPKTKWRHGKPFAVSAIVDELASAATLSARREEAEVEVVIASGVLSPFRTDDWVLRQQERLVALGARVASRAVPAGAWCYAGAAWSPR